jgi:hypothetical protein
MLASTAGRLARGKGERHVRRVDLLDRQDAHRVGAVPFSQPGPELGRPAVLGVG